MEPVMTDLAERAAIPHTAVVIIDMQNAFCAEGDTSTSGVNKSAIRSMVPRLQDLRCGMKPRIFRRVLTAVCWSMP